MRNGQAFVGFREALINFPPTFKYDVLRTIRHKRKRSKHTTPAAEVVTPLLQEPSEAGEQPELEGRHDDGHSDVSSDDGTNGELASVISSGTTFSQPDHGSDEDNDSGAESDYLRRRMAYPQPSGSLVKRLSMSAAQRAKSKLAELIKAQPSPRIIRSRRGKVSTPHSKASDQSPRSIPTTPLLGRGTPSIDNPPDGVLASVSPLTKAPSQRTPSLVGDGTAETDDDKGVYDSSSKQRVPSWCDRILFKSTIKPDPEPEDDSHGTSQRLTVSLLAAWRSFRRTSSTSLRSTPTAPAAASGTSSNVFATASPADFDPDGPRTFPTPYVPRHRRPRPRSIDVAVLPSTPSQPSFALPTAPHALGTFGSAQARRSPAPSVKGSSTSMPNTPARAQTIPSILPINTDQQHLRVPSPIGGRTPASSLASSTTASSSASAPSSGGASNASAAAFGGRGAPRWRLLSFLSRDAEVAREAAIEDHAGGGAMVAAAGADADADALADTHSNANAESPSRMVAGAAPPRSALPGGGGGGPENGTSAAGGESSSPPPRKGDVVCLSYRTLDDRGMRRLEGRSDHRPVIGVYAVYL